MSWPKHWWYTWGIAALATLVWTGPAAAAARAAHKSAMREVEPKTAPLTRVPVTIAIELAWAKAELAQRIPEQLHQESNREVAPGIAIDARVTRGRIDIRVRDDAIIGIVPIELQLRARSKLGQLVVPLGQCHTTIDTELGLPTKLSSDGKLQQLFAKAELRAPCRLTGFDITPIIRREIDQRLAAAQTQISEHMGQVNATLQQILAELWRRLSNAAVGCQRFLPNKLLQAPLTVEQDVAVARFAVQGRVTNDCESAKPSSMMVEAVATPVGFDLALPVRLGLSELAGVSAGRLQANGVDASIETVHAVRADDIDQLAFDVHSTKAKGRIFARPVVSGSALTLVSVSSKQPKLLDWVRSAFETVALPLDKSSAESLAHEVVVVANEATQAFGSTPDLRSRFQIRDAKLETAHEVQIDRDAVVVVVHRRQVAE